MRFVKINGSVMAKDTPDAITSASPLELFNYIRNASVIFTSSFHALVFAIIYRKDFYASFANNASRAESLLNHLGIRNRLLPAGSSIPVIGGDIDYISVHKRLSLLRNESTNYLEKVIEETNILLEHQR